MSQPGEQTETPELPPYDRPVIGIVTHPYLTNNEDKGSSYIAASYVKFVESAGARVIPLIYNDSRENLDKHVKDRNGGKEKDDRNDSQKDDKNDNKKDPIPLLAICLGFEHVTRIVSEVLKFDDILTPFDAKNQPSTLHFPKDFRKEGSVFESFDPKLMAELQNRPLAMQIHEYGISPDTWKNNSKLTDFFNMLTTSVDRKGQEYVSTVQAKCYPIICTQWHPEKAIFEWGLGSPDQEDKAPHSEDAVRVAQHFANYFISQSRKSTNRPCEDEVLENVVDNYMSRFREWTLFDKVYVFGPEHPKRSHGRRGRKEEKGPDASAGSANP